MRSVTVESAQQNLAEIIRQLGLARESAEITDASGRMIAQITPAEVVEPSRRFSECVEEARAQIKKISVDELMDIVREGRQH